MAAPLRKITKRLVRDPDGKTTELPLNFWDCRLEETLECGHTLYPSLVVGTPAGNRPNFADSRRCPICVTEAAANYAALLDEAIGTN